MKKLMTGNEAVARGAYEAGCMIATAYPGTPSTEILENVSTYREIYSQWSPNEKVAVEVACGASIAGLRALSAMKVVGLNVAMDPLMCFAYLGANGGLVVIVADDPGCSSSQTEQDNRLVAQHGKLLLIEPCDSQECKDYIQYAFEISEKYQMPVLFRMTTRVCHSKSIVELGQRTEREAIEYVKTGKFASSPVLSRKNHLKLEENLVRIAGDASASPLNRIEWGNRKTGIITSGVSYLHAREVFGDKASYLKLGFTHPIPEKLIREFAEEVEQVYVIEENHPYLENAVRQMGIPCTGKDRLPLTFELSPEIIRNALVGKEDQKTHAVDLTAPSRPPVLCAGCPHRSIFYAVSKLKDVAAANDIGCYTLGMVPPLGVTDAIICMGAGISAGIGLEKAFAKSGQKKKVFGFIGDSTFFHSGITGLIDAAWNKSRMTVCILDNRTTAMTGHQENPGTGKTLMGEATPVIDIEKIVLAAGVNPENVITVDAYDLAQVEAAVQKGYESDELFVIITRQPCALIKEVAKKRENLFCEVDQEKCKHCRACMKIGCPAVTFKEGRIEIAADMCNGCTLCMQVCRFDAIKKGGDNA